MTHTILVLESESEVMGTEVSQDDDTITLQHPMYINLSMDKGNKILQYREYCPFVTTRVITFNKEIIRHIFTDIDDEILTCYNQMVEMIEDEEDIASADFSDEQLDNEEDFEQLKKGYVH